MHLLLVEPVGANRFPENSNVFFINNTMANVQFALGSLNCVNFKLIIVFLMKLVAIQRVQKQSLMRLCYFAVPIIVPNLGLVSIAPIGQRKTARFAKVATEQIRWIINTLQPN